jgi:hypothetical protein
MSAANPNPMEKSIVSVLVVANAGGGSPLLCGVMLTDSWNTVEGKATQRKKQNEEADKKRAKEMSDKPPTTNNSGRGKNSHQPRPTNTSAKKTWADVIKTGGINVQIVLGNGNLGLTTPTRMRGERRGGAARRLAKKGACLFFCLFIH